MNTILPRFLREDYSPYRYKISANRENYNLYAKKIHLQNRIKTWVNTGINPFIKPVECRKCLFDTRIPNIYIGKNGLCNMCMAYEQNYSEQILKDELQTFINTPRQDGALFDAVVAFSGGKDSAAALHIASEKLNLKVIAVLVDNGFIPEAVIENGREFCERHGVELVVRNIDFKPQVREMMEDDFKRGYPCYKCGDLFHREITDFCVSESVNRVILGRNWWRWLEPEVRSVRWIEDDRLDYSMQLISLPFALHLTESVVLELLERVGWSSISIHGNSTNCLLPGMVEYQIYKRLGYHPELNLLSREVIAGFLDKEEAKQQLADIKDRSESLRKLLCERV